MQETVDRALRRQRLGVLLVLALLGAGCLVVLHFGGFGLPPLLMLLVAVGLLAVIRRPGAESLRVDPTSPAVYAPPRDPAPVHTLTLTCLLGQFVFLWALRPEPDPLSWLLAVMGTVLTVVLVVGLWQRVPLVALTPRGIDVQRPQQAFFVPWSALATDHLVLAPAAGRALRLPLARPELVEWRRGRWWSGRRNRRRRVELPLHEVDIAPEFLAAAIRHYLARPGHRPAIGTLDEYHRLPRTSGGGGPGVR